MAENTAAVGEIVSVAIDIGESLLINGGEIHRVEDTIQRILNAFGARDCDVFVINSLLTVSAVGSDGDRITLMRRVKELQVELRALEDTNEISRELCAHVITLEQAQERLKKVGTDRKSRKWFTYIGSALGAGGFAVFFGGNLLDGAMAAAIGIIMTAFMLHKPSFMNSLFQTLISSFVGGMLSYTVGRLGLPVHVDKMMAGEVMLLIPGLAMGNSVRELLVGDVISGSMRMINALLQASMIAFGYIGAMLIFTKTIF